jgi:hypothetical protein
MTREQKLANAIQYLRSRGKYIADMACKFKPTSSTHTDVAATMRGE